jgi:hypothetical protein
MSTITFDRLAYFQRLKDSGIPEAQARAQPDALDEALRDGVVTKGDLNDALAPIKTDIVVVKWMLAVIGTGVASIVLKTFFGV